MVKTYQLDEEWQEDDRGFDFYMRAMYTQSGGKDKKTTSPMLNVIAANRMFSITTGNCLDELQAYDDNSFTLVLLIHPMVWVWNTGITASPV